MVDENRIYCSVPATVAKLGLGFTGLRMLRAFFLALRLCQKPISASFFPTLFNLFCLGMEGIAYQVGVMTKTKPFDALIQYSQFLVKMHAVCWKVFSGCEALKGFLFQLYWCAKAHARTHSANDLNCCEHCRGMSTTCKLGDLVCLLEKS